MTADLIIQEPFILSDVEEHENSSQQEDRSPGLFDNNDEFLREVQEISGRLQIIYQDRYSRTNSIAPGGDEYTYLSREKNLWMAKTNVRIAFICLSR